MKFSIIIPVTRVNEHLKECIEHCLKLDYPDFEIIVLPDSEEKLDYPKTKILSTGPMGPSDKRDMGAKHSTGDILAFIDDDAYPSKSWLKEAAKHFDDPEIAAVGGPAITPNSDGFLQRASGHVYSSFMGGGSYTYRYVPKEQREVDDYPSCNFIVRKSVFQEVGGFDTKFWPGEDTKLCLEITSKLGKKIIYDPKVLVYHHRRGLFLPHLRQIGNYAVHRGHFAKKFPETSLRFSYFIPSIFLAFILIGAPISFFDSDFKWAYMTMLSIYLTLLLVSSMQKEIKLMPLIFLGILSTHLVYGAGFLKGLAVRRLKDED